MLRAVVIAVALMLASGGRIFAATQGGPIAVPQPLFPPNNWWNVDVSNAPLDPSSNAFITFINLPYSTTDPFVRRLHPDFGGDAGGGDVYGIPYIVVDGAQPKKTVTFDEFGAQSDGVGVPFYPIPDEAITMNGWVEGGQPGNVNQPGDRHMLIVDKTNNTLYELYSVFYDGANWIAGSGAFFDMKTNNRRPETWTSADAAGLAILPGLVRYDEVNGPDEIRHAIRFTVRATEGHVYPASHTAGSTSGALPMGARLRLKATKDISTHPPEIQKIFRAFKKYGLIVADNGSDMYISGVYDPLWNNGVLNPAFRSLNASDFEVVQRGWAPPFSLVVTTPAVAGSGDPAPVTVTVYNPTYNLATGYTGTIQFTSTDGAATLPVNYTFTGGDAGTHTFPAGLILRTPGSQVLTATDIGNATVTGSCVATVGPARPAGLVAAAVTLTQVNLTWSVSAGAVQYEIFRATAGTYAPIDTTATASYTDTSVTAGGAWIYRVRAIDSASRPSPQSIPDAATTIFFTDDPLVTGGTVIKSVHLTEVRQAVNAMRSAAGLSTSSFADTVLAGVAVKSVHLNEIRTSLTQARAALGLTTTPFTDPSLLPGVTTAKAIHVQELRSALK